MNTITEGLLSAAKLVVTLDPDLVEISLRSLRVTLTALVVASIIAIPLGTVLAIQRFRYRRTVIALLNAFMGLPPVVVGLVIYVLLSRAGPLGVLGLLFTPTAMVIAQVVIITPLIASVTHQAMRDLWAEYHDLLISAHLADGRTGRLWPRDRRGRGDHDRRRQYRTRNPRADHSNCARDWQRRFRLGPWPWVRPDRHGDCS